MDKDDKKHSDQFDASLPLPGNNSQNDSNPTADLIRKRVEAAYTNEPNAEKEFEEAEEIPKSQRSKHQEFIYNLTNSGRPLHEIQAAWHEYYAGLNDNEKQLVWQEFYDTHTQSAHHPAAAVPRKSPEYTYSHKKPALHKAKQKAKTKLDKVRSEAQTKARRPRTHSTQQVNPLHSILFGLGVGSIIIIVFLFSFFNERLIAPFIQPSRNMSDIPLISDSAVSPESEVIIPKINVQIPVVYDVNTISEEEIQKGLERGVVHYADTAVPGQNGNVVIVGHSSNNILNHGKYKFAFVLLSRLDNGDTFYLQKDGKRYTYQVYQKRIVKPTDISVLGIADKPATATLITCDPPGTSTNRLVVNAQQISPDPGVNSQPIAATQLASSIKTIPGNSPTLWSRLVKWFEQ